MMFELATGLPGPTLQAILSRFTSTHQRLLRLLPSGYLSEVMTENMGTLDEMKAELIEVVDHLLRAIRFKPPGGPFSFFWNKENPLLPFGSRAYQFYLGRQATRRLQRPKLCQSS
jgi:hypothetical protein